MKKKILTLALLATILTNSFSALAAERELEFGEPYIQEDTSYSEDTAQKDKNNTIKPRINSDGTFTVDINSVGYALDSSLFKVSSTSCKITMDAGAGSEAGSPYYVILKKAYTGTTVKKVKYYTGGVYSYTFDNLKTNQKYYLTIDSCKTTLHCSGTISNYKHLD